MTLDSSTGRKVGCGLDSNEGGGLEASAAMDIPFEFVGKIASASAVAEAGNVESGSSATRHGDLTW